MNNLLKSLAIFLVLSVSCKKEEIIPPTVNTPVNKIEGSFLKITHINDFLPTEYLKKGTVVTFFNAKNEKQKFTLNVDKSTPTLKRNNFFYTAEVYKIAMVSENNLHRIVFSIDAQHISDTYSPNEYLSFYINILLNNRQTITYNEKIKSLETLYFERPTKSLVLNGKEFNDTFSRETNTSQYSGIYYNAKYGIIGFKDNNNEMWAFESIN